MRSFSYNHHKYSPTSNRDVNIKSWKMSHLLHIILSEQSVPAQNRPSKSVITLESQIPPEKTGTTSPSPSPLPKPQKPPSSPVSPAGPSTFNPPLPNKTIFEWPRKAKVFAWPRILEQDRTRCCIDRLHLPCLPRREAVGRPGMGSRRKLIW